jgi:hypothetical protein
MNKMRVIISLFAIVILISCTKNSSGKINSELANKKEYHSEETQNIEKINDTNANVNTIFSSIEWLTPENDVTDLYINDFLDIYRFSKNYHDEYTADRLRYFEIALLEETMLYEINRDGKSLVRTLPIGTEIIILIQINTRDDLRYLIKLKDDSNLWSGWINEEAVPTEINEEVDNIPYGENFLITRRGNIITRNEILSEHTHWMGEFILVNKDGKVMCIIKDTEIMKIFPLAVDGGFFGWTTDYTKLWIHSNYDNYVPCFGIIDITIGKYSLFEPPPLYVHHQSVMNPDTGEIYYTDYHFQYDPETRQETKRSGKIFHLYSYNFFTKEFKEIDTNVGEGFKINFDRNNGFTYEKTNN